MTAIRTRLTCVAALALCVLVGSATPAAAHAGLLSSDPAQGDRLETLPSEVRLTFNEDMNRPSYVTVTAPDGTVLVEGEAAVQGSEVIQDIGDDPGLAGTYRVDYRVISADGHPVNGAFQFEVEVGEVVEKSTVEQVTSSRSWWIGLLAVPWVLLIVALLWRRRRRAGDTP